MKKMFEKIILRSEHDTGYPADYLRDILDASSMGFFKLMLAMPVVRHRRHADNQLHQLAQLGATQQEACGPCLEVSKAYALKSGLPEDLVNTLLWNPDQAPELQRAVFFLGRHVAGGAPLDKTLAGILEKAVGKRGQAELTVSAAAVRIFPALKRGLGYADMCALPAREENRVTSQQAAERI